MTSARSLQIFLGVALILNIALWFSVKNIQARWANIPPAPSTLGAAMSGLGDLSFLYRGYALMLQNMGDTGGRTTALKQYDYSRLADWFNLLYHFDAHSDYIPFLASYYYSAIDDPEKLRHVVDYLEKAGDSEKGEKWRWLAQAVYLARFKMNDLDRALEISQKLSALKNPDVAEWARQMPANILNAKGDKQAAYELLVNMLKSDSDKLKPNEINAMVAYICEQILKPAEAKNNPLCQDTN